MRRSTHNGLEVATGYPVFRARTILLDRRHGRVCVDMTGARTVA